MSAGDVAAVILALVAAGSGWAALQILLAVPDDPGPGRQEQREGADE